MGDIGGRWVVGLDNLRGLFQPGDSIVWTLSCSIGILTVLFFTTIAIR